LKPGQFMYDLKWTKWRCDKFLFMYCGFVLSVSFHQSSIHIIPSYTGDAVIKLRVEGFNKTISLSLILGAQTFKILAVSSFEMASL